MEKFFFTLFTFTAIHIYAQPWVQKASLPITYGLHAPIHFSINGKIYVGGGVNTGTFYNKFYEYNPSTDSWTVKADLPVPIAGSACFSINGKGYVVCGLRTNGISGAVYEYNPTTDSWQTKNPFPGLAHYNSYGTNNNGKGYVFCGFIGGSTTISDAWEYNPVTDLWTQKTNVPGPTRNGPAMFSIGSYIYVGLGSNVSGSTFYTDFYKYDPIADTYTQLGNAPVGRSSGANFAIGGIGYSGVGYGIGGVLSDFKKYNPTSDTWTSTNNFGGGTRTWSFVDVAGALPYVGAGSTISNSIVYDNWTWEVCTTNANLGNDTTLCAGNTITLSDTNTNASFLWSTGATTQSISISASGLYWLDVTKNGCTARDSINVNFISPPTSVTIGNDTTYCGTFSRLLQVNTANSILWNTNQTSNSITVNGAGTYWVQISNQCGSVRDSIVLSQNPLPVTNLGNDTTVCAGNSVILSDTNTNASFLWSTGATTPSISISASGLYWLDVTKNGCTARDSINVNFISPPTSVTIGNDTTYCGTFSRLLQVNTANSILWNTNQTSNSITVNGAGTYWVQISNQCGSVRDSIVISQNPLPVINIGADTNFACSGGSIILDASTANASYLWQDNSTNSSFTATTNGIYWVDVTINGCSSRDSTLAIFVFPITDETLDTSICENEPIVIGVTSPYSTYLWSTNENSATISINTAGVYSQTVTNGCGQGINTFNIAEKDCVCKLVFPTAFSPNEDGKNDSFGAIYRCPLTQFQLHIYNRWGELVFRSDDIENRWDGKYKDRPQPLDGYVYYYKYTDPYTNQKIFKSGNVTLLR